MQARKTLIATNYDLTQIYLDPRPRFCFVGGVSTLDLLDLSDLSVPEDLEDFDGIDEIDEIVVAGNSVEILSWPIDMMSVSVGFDIGVSSPFLSLV